MTATTARLQRTSRHRRTPAAHAAAPPPVAPLIRGIREALETTADWATTAGLIADQLTRHPPTVDILGRGPVRADADGDKS
jgi:hypothetical protein